MVMTMQPSKIYWRRRAELLNKQIHQGDNVPISRIIRLYKQAFEAIDENIRKIETARDAVIKSEPERKDLAKTALSAPDAVRQNEVLKIIQAYNFRIDRAEQVKMRAYIHLMKVAGRAAEIIKPYLKNAYLGSKYGTIDDAARGLNCGIDFSLVPERTLEKVLSEPFHGKNYSQRIWDNTAEAAGKAQKIITNGLVRGESYPHMARELQKVTQNTYYNAYRLIQTETTHFTELGRFDAYKDMGIDKYTYYATLGTKTCDVCAALDGRTFDIKDGIEGKNKPPIHPHCMCYTVIGDVKLTSRLARDPETGKNYKVRSDMTYKEWENSLTDEQKAAMKQHNKYVDNSDKSGIIEAGRGKIMSISNIDSPIEQRNTAKGNPNAILQVGRPLNNRQQKLLESLNEYDSRTVVNKKTVNMKDLSALTAFTGDEFAMFTKGGERLVIRGNTNSVNIDVQKALELSKQGYRWSGHTHPGVDWNSSMPSGGDKEILRCFKQETSVIYDSKGKYRTFDKE